GSCRRASATTRCAEEAGEGVERCDLVGDRFLECPPGARVGGARERVAVAEQPRPGERVADVGRGIRPARHGVAMAVQDERTVPIARLLDQVGGSVREASGACVDGCSDRRERHDADGERRAYQRNEELPAQPGHRRDLLPPDPPAFRLTLDPALSQMKAVPVRVLAVDVDDPLEARLLEQAGRDARAITRGAMYGDRRIVWNLGRATGNVGHVHVHRAGDMARRPLMLVARVDHRHRLGAKYPLRHVFDVDRFAAREVAAAGAPRIHAAVELTCDGVEADAQELALRLAMLGFAAAGEHDGTPARDEPADPHADRAVDADAVAAWDVRAVVVAAFTP